jgi:hypothetical protein
VPERPAPVPRWAAIALALSLSGAVAVFVTAAVLEDRSAESGPTVSTAPPAPDPTITTDVDDLPSAPAGDELPEQTIEVRLMAPDDGCWRATIGDEVRDGCGGLTLPLLVRGETNVLFERTPPAAWTWCAVVEVDGKVVMTRGPDSNPDYELAIWYTPTEYPAEYQIEPVTC